MSMMIHDQMQQIARVACPAKPKLAQWVSHNINNISSLTPYTTEKRLHFLSSPKFAAF
jgi:hypothetical protein